MGPALFTAEARTHADSTSLEERGQAFDLPQPFAPICVAIPTLPRFSSWLLVLVFVYWTRL